ncbi:MAG: hypothetical protein EZS28_021836 [Streblomastix strix]|uniref:DNA-directed DNA polymerase n=1 Tax=Streblomastix strix TaxID=222440 RepID=A0A5J4VJ08_9EUKA|nr:MAG: hypothetical protein EZS28_021836 [Streblomastix strix]
MPNSKDKRWKDCSRIAEAKRIFHRVNGVEFRDNYQGFDFFNDIDNFINKEQVNVHMYTYSDSPPRYELLQNYTIDNKEKQFNILFINDGNNAHIMYISDVEALTGFRYCNICHRQAFRIKDPNLQVSIRNHMKKCQKNGGKIVKKVILEKFAKPFVPHILSNKTYKYLLANNLTHLFKPTQYYITYDIETLEKKVNEKFGDCSQVIATLVPYAIASTVKSVSGIHSFYFDIRTDDFLDKWLEQLFEEAKQVKKDNKYKDETIPQYFEVPVIWFNSAKFDTSLVFKNLKSKDWTISKYLGSTSITKQIVVKHKQFGVQLRFVDFKIYTTHTRLKDCVRDFGGIYKKGKFPHEFINTNNYMEELNKSEPFPINAFDNQLRNKKLSELKYKEYLVEAVKFKTRWDYLQHYNILDTRILIEPIDFLINLMFKYKVDMLTNISMAQCANAIKYAMFVNQMYLFVAEVKGHIDEDYLNEVINWAPILRNIDIKTSKETIGEFMYNLLVEHKLPHDSVERKLTNLVDTMNQVMNEIVSVTTFTKQTNFNSFVKEFMSIRQQAKADHYDGLSQFAKIILNSTFGGDCLNSEKYSNTKLLSSERTFLQHMMSGFINSTELNDDLYAVQVDKDNCHCNTCLQVAYFILDSAKFWYVNFIYNFMHKAYDMNRMHFIQCDTDSLTWAISGDSNRGPEQLFEAVIKDQQFYDRYKDCVYTNNGKKKILHLSANITLAFETLDSLGINWKSIWKIIYEAGIKYACESKLCH